MSCVCRPMPSPGARAASQRVSCYVSFCDSYTATALARRKPCATSPHQKRRSTGGGWGGHPGASGASFLRGRAVSDRCPQKWRSRAEDGTLLVLVQEARHPGHGHLTLGAWARRGGDGASGVTGRGCPRLFPSWDAGRLCRRIWASCPGTHVAGSGLTSESGGRPAERWPVSCTETMADGNREGPGREEEGRREGHPRGAQEATGAPSAPHKGTSPHLPSEGQSAWGERGCMYISWRNLAGCH